AVGSFLVSEDVLEPADVIVVLGGEPPYRELEAARLYRAGWAPRVWLVKGRTEDDRRDLLLAIGVAVPEDWQIRRDSLIQLGVPRDAISVIEGPAQATLDELELVLAALGPHQRAVIVVTSPYHTRRVGLYWRYLDAGQTRAIVR